MSLVFNILAFPFTSHAQINIKTTKRLNLPNNPTQPSLAEEYSQKILPKNASADSSGSAVISEMLDNSFSLWWNNSPARHSTIGKVADTVDKKLKTEINLGTAANNKTEHKLSLKLLAIQAMAKLEYKGWIRADLNYDAKAAKTEAEFVEQISENKDFILSHSITSTEKKSQMSFQWRW